jgi:hypothetical protein
LHALVPGGGPSLDEKHWNNAVHPKQRRRTKPYLTDNVELGRMFRKHFVRGLKRLLQQEQLQIGGSVEFLNDIQQRRAWLEELESGDWNIFIEGPPTVKRGKPSQPGNMVRYLARYLTGGPISEKRIIEGTQDEVTFWARPKRGKPTDKSAGSRGMAKPQKLRLTARQFMQRWSLHILPKGFTKSRWYGGYHGTRRREYLKLCRRLLNINEGEQADEPPVDEADESTAEPAKRCPHCDYELTLVSHSPRPSWSEVFEKRIYQTDAYSPQLHIYLGRAPPSWQP